METTSVLGQRLQRCSRLVAGLFNGSSVGRSLSSLVLALSLAGSLTAHAQSTGSISGRVSESGSNNYLQGAEVAVDGTSLRTTAERDGTFHLENVPAGAHSVTATYPGLDPTTVSVDVVAGQSALTAFVLSTGNVVKLERFTVRGAKEGMAQAVALQKISIQNKLVAAADQFGPVSEGNVGEYLKFLPGVSIDYNVNDARGISLRGLSTAFTIVAVDGTPMAGSSSIDDTRRFEFEQIAMNNVETTELFKTVTPDIPATSTGGFVNFITKSAFDHEDIQRFTYDVSLSVPSTNVSFGKKGGVWGHGTHYLIRPSAEMNFSRKITPKLGVNLNYRLSEKYDDSPRTEFGYNNGQTLTDFWTAPRLSTYNIRSEEKLTHRQAFATKLDYKFSDTTALMVSGQWNWYDLNFTQRGPSFNLNTNSTRSADGSVFTSASNGAINNGILYRNKYGTTLHFNANLSHKFSDDSILSITPYYSRADGNYRDTNKGFISSSAGMVLTPTTVQSFTVTNPMTLGVLPTINLYAGTTPVSLDYIRKLANYTLTAASGNTSLQSRPWTAYDYKNGVHADYTFKGFESGKIPVTVMLGTALDKTLRTIDRPDLRYALAATTGSALTAYGDPLYTRDVALGFGSYEALDPFLTYQAVQNTIPTLVAINKRRFDESNDAVYLRLDAKVLPNLSLIGGLRYEKRTIAATGTTGTPAQALLGRVKTSTANIDFAKTYPSLSFKYNPKRNIVVRGGFSKTIGIPDYVDILPNFVSTSTGLPTAADGTVSVPAATLKPYGTRNLDLNFEYYLKNTGVISVSVFHKAVKDFIISRNMTAAEQASTYTLYGLNAADFGATTGLIRVNGPDTTLKGIEASYSQNLTFLPKPFSGLNVQANFTLMDISASSPDPLLANDAELAQNRGVSPKTANLIIGYRQGPVNITMTNNWVSESVFGGFVGTSAVLGALPTVAGIDNRLVLVRGEKLTSDIKIEYFFNKKVSAYFLVRNIFNSPRKDYARGYLPQYRDIKLPYRYYEFGEPHLTVGLRGSF